jgi:gluconate:H+ symporter, GntP family
MAITRNIYYDKRKAAMHPILILIIGIAVVIGMIVVLRINAFLALITAAIVVSILAPGSFAVKISRVAEAFGSTAGKIGIIIAMAAVIGRCLIESGAADRIVRVFVRLLGPKYCPVSLMTSGFVLSVPVFFDTVFYLLLPLARSMHRRTNISYVLLILAMGAGASITHSLVPPTPGPLIIAGTLNIDLGVMICVGLLVAACTAVVMLFFVMLLSKKNDIPMRPLEGGKPEPDPLPDDKLPSLLASLAPIILPVILISANTVVATLIKSSEDPSATLRKAKTVTALIGNANFAMLLSAAIAMIVYYRQRKPSRDELAKTIESSLMSGGVIILITSGGGAFGAMLKAAEIGPAIQNLLVSDSTATLGGIQLLLMAFLVATLIKFAQGSSTVSMITTSAMIAPLIGAPHELGYHPVYLAAAIGFGAQCGNWMNDSGFWIFAKMSGLTEVETLKTWTVTISVLAVVGLLFTIAFSKILPLLFLLPQ